MVWPAEILPASELTAIRVRVTDDIVEVEGIPLVFASRSKNDRSKGDPRVTLSELAQLTAQLRRARERTESTQQQELQPGGYGGRRRAHVDGRWSTMVASVRSRAGTVPPHPDST